MDEPFLPGRMCPVDGCLDIDDMPDGTFQCNSCGCCFFDNGVVIDEPEVFDIDIPNLAFDEELKSWLMR